jgi:hypothetical protein
MWTTRTATAPASRGEAGSLQVVFHVHRPHIAGAYPFPDGSPREELYLFIATCWSVDCNVRQRNCKWLFRAMGTRPDESDIPLTVSTQVRSEFDILMGASRG